jgi:hypothetical protein
MTTSSSSRLAAWLLAAAMIAPSAAWATSPEDLASARELVKQGREARKAQDLVGALEKFKAAYALAQTAVTAIELARTEEALGQLVEAREMCLSIARMPVEADETHLSTDARAEAADLAQKLAPRIPSIVVRVAGLSQGEAAEVSVDGARVPPESLGETRKVDPGTHAVAVKRGDETESSQVTVGEGENKEVILTLKALPAHQGGIHVEPPPPRHDQPPPPPPPPPSHTAAYVAFGVAGAGIAVGAVTGLMAVSGASTLSHECPDYRCPPSAHGDLDSTTTLGTVSTITFGVGIVAAVVGIYSLSSHATPASSASSSATVSPLLGLGSLGVHGSF